MMARARDRGFFDCYCPLLGKGDEEGFGRSEVWNRLVPRFALAWRIVPPLRRWRPRAISVKQGFLPHSAENEIAPSLASRAKSIEKEMKKDVVATPYFVQSAVEP